jgi:hypothetical protein
MYRSVELYFSRMDLVQFQVALLAAYPPDILIQRLTCCKLRRGRAASLSANGYRMASTRRLAANLFSGMFNNMFRIGFHLLMLPLMARFSSLIVGG